MGPAPDILENILEFVRDKHVSQASDANWTIVGEIADHFNISPRDALNAIYALESYGCVRVTVSPDLNERGAVVQFKRPMIAPLAPTNVFNINSVGAIQTGSQSIATVNQMPEPASAEPDPYSGPYDPERTPPFDSLPITEEMRRAMPSLHLQFGRILVDPRGFFIAWKVVNIGVGTAKRVRVFIPVLGVDEIGNPLQPGESIIRKRSFPPRFPHLKPSEGVSTLEYEDFAGRQYRQYSRLTQYHVGGDKYPNLYGLRSSETSQPFRVSRASLAEHNPFQGVETLDPRLQEWYFS